MAREEESSTNQQAAEFDAAAAARKFLTPPTQETTLETLLARKTGASHAELNGKKTDDIAPSVFGMKALPGDELLHPATRALAERRALRAEYEAEMANRKAESPKPTEATRATIPSSADIFKPRFNR